MRAIPRRRADDSTGTGTDGMAKRKLRAVGRHVRDVSIATRMTLVIAGLLAVFMLTFGVFLRGFVRQAVKRQIMWAAYESAYTAAQADLAAWTEYFGTPFQGRTREELTELVAGMTPAQYAERYASEQVTRLRDLNKARFAGFVAPGLRIVAVELLDLTEGAKLLAQSYRGDGRFTPVVGEPPISVRTGEVAEGDMSVQGRTQHVIRGAYPVSGTPEGRRVDLVVYIDAGAVDDAMAELTWKVGVASLAFIFVGSLVSWLVTQRLMRPVHLLQEDMRIVAGGDLEHHTTVHSRDEIGGLARSFGLMTESLLAARQAERETAAGRHQMSVAGEVAASLFPTRLPDVPGYDLAGHHEASGQLGGEYYDVLEMPGGRYAFLVGSASGSGVPAAMVMAMARSFLAALARSEADPGKVLREVNALLSGDLRRGMYVTVLLAVLDPGAGTLTLANAGHAPLLYCKAGGKSIAPVQSEGIALGFDKGPVFDQTLKVVRLALGPGDRAVLFTPGVTRVTGADGSALGESRFAAVVKRETGQPAAAFVRRVAATVKKFRGERPLSEDVTLLTLGRLSGGPS
jgi:serine phosphatase RsbU (regulator of sigma subunit)